jgi:uncharacterized phage infection (PIP) family protein YhgE
MPSSHALEVRAAGAGSALSPAQKRFNTLIRQIERARQTLQLWQEGIAAFRHAHAELLRPLQAELVEGQRQWVRRLDAVLREPGWTKAERELLRELLCEAAGELLDGGHDDPELKALFDRHADVDYDSDKRDEVRAMKQLAEAITGLDLGDDEGLHDEAQLFERLQQGFQTQAEAEAAERQARAARRRPSAAQQRREAEAQQATQSLREIYRKLASALHPDRETDPAEREAKTALMQRVNQAYEAQDLLALLQLQLQIEQIDESHLANASEQRLKHYNKVLAEQLAELKAELERVEIELCMEFHLDPDQRYNPAQLGRLLDQTHREWRAEQARQRHELRTLDDRAATKRWLKRQRQLRREAAFGFGGF